MRSPELKQEIHFDYFLFILKKTFRDEFAEATVGYVGGKYDVALEQLFQTDSFATRVHRDTVGVEMCGAMKNVTSLASGYCEGLGLGHNVKVEDSRFEYCE